MREPNVSPNSALVMQGGGARGAFTAGVLDVLMENKIVFPYVIGTSAGALNGVNYISNDIGRSKYVSTELMSDKRFVSLGNFFRRGTAFDFAYLFHTVPKTTLPFDSAEYNSSPIEFAVCATGMEDGEPHYFKHHICNEFYKALAASSSLPLISKPVDVEGKKYLDGGVTVIIPYQKAFDDGYSKVVVIQTRARGYRKGKLKGSKVFLARCMYRKYPEFIKAYRHINDRYNDSMAEVERLAEEGRVFLIAPDTEPEIGSIAKDKDALLRLYEEGREVMQRDLRALKEFVGFRDE